MENFTFYNPVKIIFGKGQIAQLSKEISADKKVLITYGGGSIKKNGVYDQVIQSLQGYKVFEFGGIEPNPRYETLMRAVDFIRENDIDFILAVGGGSAIDGTKFISAAVNYKAGDPWEIVAKAAKFSNAIPFGTVLTLPATASEMNNGSVITRDLDKLAFMDPQVFPQFSILDPETTFTLPPNQIANGVVDAFVHVMEAYLTYPVNAKLQDRVSEGILLSLIEDGPVAMKNPQDYDVRANIMWCAPWALNGMIGAGVPQDWATHRIGHELTVLYGLDHGVTLAIILPALMQVKRKQKRDKILQYAERIWQIDVADPEQAIDQAIAKTSEFFESLGIKTHLSDYGLGEEAITKVLAQLDKHELTTLGEHQDIDLQQSELILKLSL